MERKGRYAGSLHGKLIIAIPAFWNEGWIAALVNHLWQSTVVIWIVSALALRLRKNHTHACYWILMAASIKFLPPFSLLSTSVGSGGDVCGRSRGAAFAELTAAMS